MIRPRLRSKTGCLKCRARRKKCGEEKPVCVNCDRWNFGCFYPQSNGEHRQKSIRVIDAESFLPHSANTSLLYYQSGFLTNGFSRFHDDQELSLIKWTITSVDVYLTSKPGGAHSVCMTLLLQNAWMREAFMAFAAAAMAKVDPDMDSIALSSYVNAIQEARLHMDQNHTGVRDVCLNTVILILGNLEVLSNSRSFRDSIDFDQIFTRDNPEAAVTHYSFLARQAPFFDQSLKIPMTDSIVEWHKSMIQFALFKCSTLWFWDPRVSFIFKEEELPLVESFCLSRANKMKKESDQIVSLGFRLMGSLQLRLAYIARHQTQQAERDSFSQTASDQIQTIFESTLERVLDTFPEAAHKRAYAAMAASREALRLCVTTITHPYLCSNDPRIVSLVSRQTKHIRAYLKLTKQSTSSSYSDGRTRPDTNVGREGNLGKIWINILALCAAREDQTFELYAEMLQNLCQFSQNRIFERVSGLIKTLRQRRLNFALCTLDKGQPCQVRHDGLDLLRQPAGFM